MPAHPYPVSQQRRALTHHGGAVTPEVSPPPNIARIKLFQHNPSQSPWGVVYSRCPWTCRSVLGLDRWDGWMGKRQARSERSLIDMLWILAGVLVLHGLVHMLYLGHVRGLFELQPGMAWPSGSWVLSSWMTPSWISGLSGALLPVAAAAFAAAGVALLASQAWWRPLAVGAAGLSTILYVLMWDGTSLHLDNQGAFGVLINLTLLGLLLWARWPRFEF